MRMGVNPLHRKQREEALRGEEQDPEASWELFPPQLQPANRSYYPGRYASYSSVSQEPPPAFLTEMPLGTPLSETRGTRKAARPRAKPMPNVVRPHKEETALLPLQRFDLVHHEDYSEPGPERDLLKGPVAPQQRRQTKGFMYHWIYEEVRLSMSKISIVGLVLGLMFLGTLFFVIGFLAAVSTVGSGSGEHPPSAWQASNTVPQDQAQEHGGVPGGAVGRIATGMAKAEVGRDVRHALAPLNRMVGSASTAVPRPLQPFARYGASQANLQTRGAVNQLNPLSPTHRSRERVPPTAQQPYGGTAPGYAYPPAPIQNSYGQGGGGYAPAQPQPTQPSYPMAQQPMQPYPQQQPMVQYPMAPQAPNPYYQQPMAQQAAPLMMAPQAQMPPQQPAMQPSYPQQVMPPQPGYYR